MFESIKKRVKGVFPYSRLADEVRTIFYSHVNDETMHANHSCWRVASSNPDKWFADWLAFAEKRLHRIAESKDAFTQMIAIRKETVDVTEESISALTYFDDEYSDEDRIVIGKTLMPESNEKDYGEIEYFKYVYNDITRSIFRMLSLRLFNDAHAHDWFDLFSDIYKQFTQHTYLSIVANNNDSAYPLEPMGPLLMQTIEQMKEKLYQGNNWEYDKEKIEAETEEDEKQRELDDEAKKRPKQRTVTNSQIEDLSEYLTERMGRLGRGELYTTPKDDKEDKLYPVSPENAIWTDLGLMLIALTECVEDDETAKKTLKRIAIKAHGKYINSSNIDNIDIDIPEAFLEIWKENDERLALVIPAIVKLLYGDITDMEDLKSILIPGEDNEEWDKTINQLEKSAVDLSSHIGLSIMGDVLEVQHYTKQVFGWDVGEYKRALFFTEEPSSM